MGYKVSIDLDLSFPIIIKSTGETDRAMFKTRNLSAQEQKSRNLSSQKKSRSLSAQKKSQNLPAQNKSQNL